MIPSHFNGEKGFKQAYLNQCDTNTPRDDKNDPK